MPTAERPRTATVATAVFAALVVATVAAFFVTQRLKRSAPVVRHVMLPLYISPNGDGRKDRAVIKFRLPKADDRVTVSITDANGDEVLHELHPERLIFEAPKKHQQVWFIEHIGPGVNLGNVMPADVIALETLRLGLRADTLKLFHGDAG